MEQKNTSAPRHTPGPRHIRIEFCRGLGYFVDVWLPQLGWKNDSSYRNYDAALAKKQQLASAFAKAEGRQS